MTFKPEEILSSELVEQETKRVFHQGETTIERRPASYIIRLIKEPEGIVKRIILLRPRGHTSNRLNELNSHPEARKAIITIRGGIRPGRSGFNLLKKSIKFVHVGIKAKTMLEQPYAYANSPHTMEELKSSRTRFYVVRENGWGFYHSLINLTDEWVLLVLEKHLRQSKPINLRLLKNKALKTLCREVTKWGDNVFEESPYVLSIVLKMSPDEALPGLIALLNMDERGNHEPCTIFAIILKIGQSNPHLALDFLKRAMEKEQAPSYYLQELIMKIQARMC